jgi:hypothetical protein
MAHHLPNYKYTFYGAGQSFRGLSHVYQNLSDDTHIGAYDGLRFSSISYQNF